MPDGFTRVFQRGLETLVAEGLQQVVDSMGFERTNRVPIVRGDEDRDRHPIERNLAQHTEAVELGHLDIEQEKRRVSRSDQRDGLAPVACDAHDFDVAALFK